MIKKTQVRNLQGKILQKGFIQRFLLHFKMKKLVRWSRRNPLLALHIERFLKMGVPPHQ